MQPLIEHLNANYTLLSFRTAEETRAEKEIARAAVATGRDLYRWSITRGLQRFAGGAWASVDLGLPDPQHAAAALAGGELAAGVRIGREAAADENSPPTGRPAIVIFADVSPYLRDPVLVRRFRDALAPAAQRLITGIFLGPVLDLPVDLQREVAELDFPLPNERDLEALVEITHRANAAHADLRRPAGEELSRLVAAARGLTVTEAELALTLSIVRTGQLTPAVVAGEKARAVRASGALEILQPPAGGLDAVGGLEAVKRWVLTRVGAFAPEARDYGLPMPRGLLLVGVQGCGKSLAARAAAAAVNLPLVRLNVGALFGGLVGESEANVRAALKTLDAVAPCVCMVDELEKAFAGSSAGRSHDSGTSSRVLGDFLTWTQEHESPVLLMATANDVTALPPELIRAGRWDGMMFVDLPDVGEKAEICRIHLRARGRDPARFDIGKIADAAAGFSGAEIEAAIISAMFEAFARTEEIATADILAAVASTVPLSKTMQEPIARLREWASTRCVPAHGRVESKAKIAAGRKVA